MKKPRCVLCVLLMAFLCIFIHSCGDNGENPAKSENKAPENEEKFTQAEIDILKVGKADCIVINTGTKIIMIDTAEKENIAQINSYMQGKGYERVDTLILTHYDKDHIGCANDIITNYGVATVIESRFIGDSDLYVEYHNTIREKGIDLIKLTENYSLSCDNCSLVIYPPQRKKYEIKEDNNSSLVISVKTGNNKLLFCGDAMESRLSELTKDSIGHYDFVKLPYHGAYLENYREFIDMISPSYAAITCSKKNPADERTLALMEEYGVSVYETRYGEINIIVSKDSIIINQ